LLHDLGQINAKVTLSLSKCETSKMLRPYFDRLSMTFKDRLSMTFKKQAQYDNNKCKSVHAWMLNDLYLIASEDACYIDVKKAQRA